jgi:hypothetical protein
MIIQNKVFYADQYSNDPQLTLDGLDNVLIKNCEFRQKNLIGHIIFSTPSYNTAILINNV